MVDRDSGKCAILIARHPLSRKYRPACLLYTEYIRETRRYLNQYRSHDTALPKRRLAGNFAR